ncbi:MAG TPA: hypothetical protein VN437_06250 [Rectinemataceae bacterium]|nr:hypothetical protein [Rectinemataceae bacterium]
MIYEYRAFGMHITSKLALALPKAPHYEDVPVWPVSIGFGDVKSDPSLPHSLGRIRFGLSGNDIQVEVPWAGRYRIKGDSRIDVEPEPSADEKTVGLYITGLVLTFLLRRRPFLTLHGSAVAGPNGALAFLGDRGSGKSTTAMALIQAGYEMLCDDVIPIAAGPLVFPGIPLPKLLSDAYERLVGDSSMAKSLFDGVDKYQVDLPASHTPAHLHSIFVLEPTDVPNLEIAPLRGSAKFAALLPFVCSSPGIDDTRTLFTRCTERLGTSVIIHVARPATGYSLPELIERIVQLDRGEGA